MKHKLVGIMIAGLLAACGVSENQTPQTVNGLQNAASFSSIVDDAERSALLFDEMFKVISHPRCMNCHTSDDSVRIEDDLSLHLPPVVRGESDFGAPAMQCSTCHSDENVSYLGMEGSIPGHEGWRLAPIEMAWIGKAKSEICAQLKDKDKNGNRSLKDLHKHNAEDGLVGWGWQPGEGRTAAPGNQKVFGDLTQAWIESGAACPVD